MSPNFEPFPFGDVWSPFAPKNAAHPTILGTQKLMALVNWMIYQAIQRQKRCVSSRYSMMIPWFSLHPPTNPLMLVSFLHSWALFLVKNSIFFVSKKRRKWQRQFHQFNVRLEHPVFWTFFLALWTKSYWLFSLLVQSPPGSWIRSFWILWSKAGHQNR